MEGIDISKTKIPEFGPLSLSWFKPMYIDDEKWSNVISYVWAQLLCFDVYKAIVKNWKTGFPNYLKTFKYDHNNKKYFKPNSLQKNEIQLRSTIDVLKLFNKTVEESISGLETMIQLLENWDSIDDPEFNASKIFTDMKKSLTSVLEEKNRIKYDKEGKITNETTSRQAFVQFFNRLPFAAMVSQTQKRRGKPIKTDILSDISDDDEFDIENNDIRESIIGILEDKMSEVVTAKEETEKELSSLAAELQKLKEKEYFSREELKEIWKQLPRSEKKKFEKSLKKEFLNMMYQCRKSKFKEYLTIVYQNVVQNDNYRNSLMQTLPNLQSYFLTGQIKHNRIIYIDPFNFQKPLLGVGVIDNVLRGANNVGRVLMDLRKELIVKKKEHLDEETLAKSLSTKKRFLLAHGKLADLLRQRDIKEFIGLNTDQIIQRLNDGFRVQTPNRSYLIYPDCSVVDCKNLSLDKVSELLKDMGLEDIEVQSYSKMSPDFPELTESTIDFIYDKNVNGVKTIFDYEESKSGNLANFLRKQYLRKLYEVQVEEEKMNIVRAVLEFLYLSDTKNRVKVNEMEALITQELSDLPSLELAALIEVLDTAYTTGQLEEVVADKCGVCDKQVTIGDTDYDIAEFVAHVLERDVKKGKLISRVRQAQVNEAEDWKFLKQTINKIPNTTDIVPIAGQDLLDPRDLHVASLFEGSFGEGQKSNELLQEVLGATAKSDLDNVIQAIQQDTISQRSNPKMSGDIIFSSVPGQYQPFELSPTAPIICTIDYFKFPTVLHAVCYLWFTREFKIPRNQSYQMLLKENWRDLLISLRIFDEINEIPFNEFKTGLESRGFLDIAQDIEQRLRDLRKTRIDISAGPQVSSDWAVLDDLPISRSLLKHELIVRLLDSNKYEENPFVTWDESYKILVNMMDRNMFETAKKALDKAHEVKFDTKTMKQLLSRTGSSILYHGDREDVVLGIGPNKNGLNLAGNSLMELRQALREQSSDILEPDDEISEQLVALFTGKLNLFGELLQLLNKHFNDLDLAVKLARGFLVLYKINCGSGEGAPFKITSKLQYVVKDISKKYSERYKNVTSLLWDYIKIMYGQFTREMLSKPTVSPEKSCMFDVNEKSISKLTEEKAKVIVTKLLRCLLIEFDSQDKINKIDEIAKEIISSNIGRSKYIGKLKLKQLTPLQREQIINGEVEYYDM